MVTHDSKAAAGCSRLLYLLDGSIKETAFTDDRYHSEWSCPGTSYRQSGDWYKYLL